MDRRIRGLHRDRVDVAVGDDIYRDNGARVVLLTAADHCGSSPGDACAMLSPAGARSLAKALIAAAERAESDRG